VEGFRRGIHQAINHLTQTSKEVAIETMAAFQREIRPALDAVIAAARECTAPRPVLASASRHPGSLC